MARLLLLPPALLAAVLSLSLARGQAPEPGQAEKVKKLVLQLGAADRKAQVAAELELLRLGPDILPEVLTRLPAAKGAARQKLEAVVGTLRELKPRTFTLNRVGITLNEALKELTRQTGIAVVNKTGQTPGPKFDLKCEDVPFWRALDTIAAAAGARVSLYQSDGGVALVGGWGGKAGGEPAPLAVSYHGLCRMTVKHVTVTRDLETGAHTCAVQLDVAWEPRFTAFRLGTGAGQVAFAPDAGGKVVKADLPSGARYQLAPPVCAQEVTLRTRAPHRSSPAIAMLKGSFVLTGAPKMLDFAFDRLRELGPKDKAVGQTREGVGVRLNEVSVETDPDRFIFGVVIDNPPGTATFESHEAASWLGNNAIWLEKKGGVRLRLGGPLDIEEVKRSAEQAILRYNFTQKANRNVRFGRVGDWRLHYRTPGRIVEVTVPCEFKNVPLP
jgi:hypothetical protein